MSTRWRNLSVAGVVAVFVLSSCGEPGPTPMSLKGALPHIPSILTGVDGPRLMLALEFWRAFLRHREAVHQGFGLARVSGGQSVQSTVLAPVDGRWRPSGGARKRVAVDTVAVGYGLMPSVEFTRQLGCEHRYDEVRGYWRVTSDVKGRTSVPWVLTG